MVCLNLFLYFLSIAYNFFVNNVNYANLNLDGNTVDNTVMILT